MRVVRIILLSLVFVACSQGSLEDFRSEGQEIVDKITKELRDISTDMQLQEHNTLIKELFEDLVDCAIEARLYQIEHPSESLSLDFYYTKSDALQLEIKRIYQLPRGREMMEAAQMTALSRLDSFERHLDSGPV